MGTAEHLPSSSSTEEFRPKFTKGPWRQAADAGDPATVFAGRRCVATCWEKQDNGDEIANAHLISAAPDLYEALVALLEDQKFQTAVGGNPIAVDKMLTNARAALAKARGSAPAETQAVPEETRAAFSNPEITVSKTED